MAVKRFNTKEEALEFVDSLPMNTIRYMLADYLMEGPRERIVVTQEQFNAFFKIRGVREDGGMETRGRKRSE